MQTTPAFLPAPSSKRSSHALFLASAALTLLCVLPSAATVDDALSFALEAAEPYVRQGFTVREDYWGGDLGVGDSKTLPHQLFKGLEYWFWLGTDVDAGRVTVNIYDSKGNRCDDEHFSKGRFAGARVKPAKTGTYYIVVTVRSSPEERTPWGLAYGYR